MNKKGQAAMEFLMTYGWAILVVIAAIAALAYFGVLDPARLLPERCQFPAGMDCIDKAAIDGAAGTVTVALRNNQGFPVEVDAASLTATGCGSATSTVIYKGVSAIPVNVSNNDVFQVKFSGCTLKTGDKFDDNAVKVTYTNTESGLQNSALGAVRGRVS